MNIRPALTTLIIDVCSELHPSRRDHFAGRLRTAFEVLEEEINSLEAKQKKLEKKVDESKEPWYDNGQPVPWTPGDGQW